MLYFFALFVVAMDNVLRESRRAPCFGKAIVPPWVAAAFDLAVLLLLATAALPQASHQPRQRSRCVGLAVVFPRLLSLA